MELTSNELEIMNVLWNMVRPLTRSEIIELSPDRTWKASSIHILLNSLLDKKAIEVTGFTRTGKNYGRMFAPLILQDDYLLKQLKQNYGNTFPKSSAVTKIFSVLLNDKDIDDEAIGELEQMIAERKKKR